MSAKTNPKQIIGSLDNQIPLIRNVGSQPSADGTSGQLMIITSYVKPVRSDLGIDKGQIVLHPGIISGQL